MARLNLGLDAYSPREISEKIESLGVAKVRLGFLQTGMLAILAGAFIALGALFYVVVASDTSLGFAASRVLGGLVFSLGLILVTVGGAELFTGNNLLAMAWAGGRISTLEVLRNWLIVCVTNFAGAAGLALLVYLSGHPEANDGAVARAYLKIAAHKAALDPWRAFFLGMLCNVLVCMAVWMAMAGHSVVDRFIAIVFPISAFVAAGFEHSIANMYFFPLAMLLDPASTTITVGTMLGNLGPVIAGNLFGGSVLVALVYWVIYLRGQDLVPGHTFDRNQDR